jgi:hypothetical protein
MLVEKGLKDLGNHTSSGEIEPIASSSLKDLPCGALGRRKSSKDGRLDNIPVDSLAVRPDAADADRTIPSPSAARGDPADANGLDAAKPGPGVEARRVSEGNEASPDKVRLRAGCPSGARAVPDAADPLAPGWLGAPRVEAPGTRPPQPDMPLLMTPSKSITMHQSTPSLHAKDEKWHWSAKCVIHWCMVQC